MDYYLWNIQTHNVAKEGFLKFKKWKMKKRLKDWKNVMKTSNCLSSCNTFNYALALLIGRKWMEQLGVCIEKKKQPRWLKKNCIIENIMPILLESFNQTFLLIMTQFFNFFFQYQTVASLIARKWMDKLATFFLLSPFLHFDFQF